MRFRVLFYIILLSICTFSCSKIREDVKFDNQNDKTVVELTPEEIVSVSYDYPKELTEKEIFDVIYKFKNSITFKTKTVLSNKHIIISKITKKQLPIYTSKNIPLAEVEVSEGEKKATAILCTDSRAPIILAYYYTPDSSSDKQYNFPLIELSEYALIERVELIEIIKDSLRLNTINKISEKLKINKGNWSFEKYKDRIKLSKSYKLKSVLQPTLDIYYDGQIVSSVGPLIPVSWNIGMPYNRLMPQNCPNNWLWDQRTPLSSSAIAIAHILSFFQPPITVDDYANGGTNNLPINWSYLTENKEILEEAEYFGTNPRPQDPIDRRNMVSSLLRFIGVKCGINYSCNSSNVNDVNLIAFLNMYNIKTSPVQNFDIQKIRTSLQNINPVLMYGQTSAGSGSWWVVDGIAITSFLNVGPKYNPDGSVTVTGLEGMDFGYTYLHANMGYGECYNGYYYATCSSCNLQTSNTSMNFNPGYAEFTKNFKMYPDVRPD